MELDDHVRVGFEGRWPRNLPAAALEATAGAAAVVEATGAAAALEVAAFAFPAVAVLPAAACPVKFLKPFSVRRSAMLFPVASSGAFAEEAERAFATFDPPTAGSIKGVIPLNFSVAGRVGSSQIVGML